MEDMETVFELTQESERSRLRFFKEVLLEIHEHLDLSTRTGSQAWYRDLGQTIRAVSDSRTCASGGTHTDQGPP
ncbi:hypothetical protein NQD34_018450 [Periophthalmus magnuspinnatus]|nr:hypothetical protein NQD34_018450 [Periophthalmus magnuspinnatus]